MAKNSAANLLTSVDSLFTTQAERDMPKTGASSGMILRIASLLAAIGCLGFLLHRRKVH